MEVRGKQQKTLQAQVYTLNEHLFEPQSFRFHKQENISSKKPIKGSTKNVLSHLRDQSEREGRAGDEGGGGLYNSGTAVTRSLQLNREPWQIVAQTIGRGFRV